jgi:hypothetical protein
MEDGQGILPQAIFVLIVGIHDGAPQLSTFLRFTLSTSTLNLQITTCGQAGGGSIRQFFDRVRQSLPDTGASDLIFSPFKVRF